MGKPEGSRLDRRLEAKIIDIVDEAANGTLDDCLETLRAGLNRLGCGIPDGDAGRKAAYETALRYYAYARERRIPLESIRPAETIKELPATVLEFEGKTYFIHGVVHAGLSSRTRRTVRDACMRYHRPAEDTYLFYEEMLDHEFRIERGIDFKDAEGIDALDLILYGREKREGVKRPVGYTVGESMDEYEKYSFDLRFGGRAREMLRRTNLPEPLSMAYFSSGIVNRIEGSRSALMAKTVFEMGGKEIHMIVGLGHEPQIAYFLKGLEKSAGRKLLGEREVSA